MTVAGMLILTPRGRVGPGFESPDVTHAGCNVESRLLEEEPAGTSARLDLRGWHAIYLNYAERACLAMSAFELPRIREDARAIAHAGSHAAVSESVLAYFEASSRSIATARRFDNRRRGPHRLAGLPGLHQRALVVDLDHREHRIILQAQLAD